MKLIKLKKKEEACKWDANELTIFLVFGSGKLSAGRSADGVEEQQNKKGGCGHPAADQVVGWVGASGAAVQNPAGVLPDRRSSRAWAADLRPKVAVTCHRRGCCKWRIAALKVRQRNCSLTHGRPPPSRHFSTPRKRGKISTLQQLEDSIIRNFQKVARRRRLPLIISCRKIQIVARSGHHKRRCGGGNKQQKYDLWIGNFQNAVPTAAAGKKEEQTIVMSFCVNRIDCSGCRNFRFKSAQNSDDCLNSSFHGSSAVQNFSFCRHRRSRWVRNSPEKKK